MVKHAVDSAATKAVIDVVPDQRFKPVCRMCADKEPPDE